MNINIPCFEINGYTYYIKRNRYLQAEFDTLKQSAVMSEDEQLAYAKEQDFSERLEKIKKRKDELYEKFLETFNEEDETLYKKAEIAYNMILDEASKIESISAKQRQIMLDIGEKLIIKALQIDEEGKQIRSKEEATNIWENFVTEHGQFAAIQFIVYTSNYIIGTDEEFENPFIAQAKAKAEQRANMKRGIAKVK